MSAKQQNTDRRIEKNTVVKSNTETVAQKGLSQIVRDNIISAQPSNFSKITFLLNTPAMLVELNGEIYKPTTEEYKLTRLKPIGYATHRHQGVELEDACKQTDLIPLTMPLLSLKQKFTYVIRHNRRNTLLSAHNCG